MRVIALGAILTVSLAAYGGGKADGGKTVESKGPVTLTVYSWDNEYAIKAATDKFNELSKDVKVNLILTPYKEYQNKLFVSLAGSEDIDAYFIRETEAFSTYVDKGLAYRLDDLMKAANFDVNMYGEYVDQLKSGGKTYALPYRGAGLLSFLQ